MIVLDTRSELIMLRDVVLRCHGLAGGGWIQRESERLRRIDRLCEAAIQQSPEMSGFLGRINGNSADILAGGDLSGPENLTLTVQEDER